MIEAADFPTIQDALDEAASQGGGRVHLTAGAYTLSATLAIPEGVRLEGDGCRGHMAGAGATQIIAAHTNGAAVRLMGESSGLMDVSVLGDSARYASSTPGLYGVQVEAPDNATDRTTCPLLQRVRSAYHPSHGVLLIGVCVNATVDAVNVDHVKGHGFVVDSGQITGRANKARPGQLALMNCRATRTAGHAALIGGASTASVDQPYRVGLVNFEAFYNAYDEGVRLVPANVYIVGDNHKMELSGISGQEENGQDILTAVRVTGQQIQLHNNRYLQCAPYAVHVEHRAAMPTVDVDVRMAHIVNTFRGVGYYSPLVQVDAGCQNVAVEVNETSSLIGSLMPKSSLNYGMRYLEQVEWAGSLKALRTVTGGAFRSSNNEVTIADNGAGYIDFSAVTRGILLVSGNIGGARSALVHFRVGDASGHCTPLALPANVGVTTGPLSGTTGADGSLTISAHQNLNRLYIENRTGGLRGYSYALLDCAGGDHIGFVGV